MSKIKLVIISDTHITKDTRKLDVFLRQIPLDTDYIIHAGDYANVKVIDILEQYGQFIGVWGNIDDIDVKSSLKEKELIELKGYRIGITHGHGDKKTTIDRAYDMFENDKPDIIIFGHSHKPIISTKNGVIMINPGSITNKRREKMSSFAILELEDKKIEIKTIFC